MKIQQNQMSGENKPVDVEKKSEDDVQSTQEPSKTEKSTTDTPKVENTTTTTDTSKVENTTTDTPKDENTTTTTDTPKDNTQDLKSESQDDSGAPVFEKALDYIPYKMLTKEVIRECIMVKNLKPNKGGKGKTIWMKFDLRRFRQIYPEAKVKCDGIIIKTPYMHLPFGPKEFENNQGAKTLTLTPSFGNIFDDEVVEFETWAKEVYDPTILEILSESSENFFGKKMDKVIMETMFSGLYRYTDDDQKAGYDPKTFAFKIYELEKLECTHGEGNSIPFDIEHIPPQESYASLTVEIGTIWILNMQCGVGGVLKKVDLRTKDEMLNEGFALNQ